MKFTCNRQDFSKGISTVIKATYSKFQKSILECIHISAGNELLLDAFDTVTAIRTSVYADIKENGEAAIPARILQDIVSKFPDGEICLESKEGGGIIISGGRSSVLLQEMDASQFPSFPSVEGVPFVLKQGQIRTMIDKTAFSAYQDEDKPIFTGILMESGEDTISAVAIDGVRMAKYTLKKEGAPEGLKKIIPAKSLKEVARLFNDDEKDVKIYFSDSACFMETDNISVYTRLLDGEFMNYESIISKSCKTRVRVEKSLIIKSLEMVSVLAREDSFNLVRILIEQNILKLESTSEYGAASDEIPVLMDGESVKIAFNARYLLDIFKTIEENEVFLEFNESLKPCLVKPVEGQQYLYIVVPMKVAG